MKRLVFFFDGTYQKLAGVPTNVVLTAASVKRQTDNGTVQIIHYDEGVGTGPDDERSGGWFGEGLLENVREAFRFLIFNYDAGDEIFVFGYSRGAFSARTFVGFLRYVGPLTRAHVDRIDEALQLYVERLANVPGASERMAEFRANYSSDVCISPEDDEWRCRNQDGYVSGSAPLMSIKYLGVWDTVRSLGAGDPLRQLLGNLPIVEKLAQKNDYHDIKLTAFVESARHAVAIDERRVVFPCELWDNMVELNQAKGFAPEDIRMHLISRSGFRAYMAPSVVVGTLGDFQTAHWPGLSRAQKQQVWSSTGLTEREFLVSNRTRSRHSKM